MKKWMIAGLLLLVALFAALYIFIPGHIRIQKTANVSISQEALRRTLIENIHWNRGWPASDSSGVIRDSGLCVIYNQNTYAFRDQQYSSILLTIYHGSDSIGTGSINMAEISKGLVRLDWEASLLASNNPLQRLSDYRSAKQMASDVQYLLDKMAGYYSVIKNVYGIDIRQEAVRDTTLLSAYDSSKGYPSNELIYSLVSSLQKYTSSQQANVTGYPMLNIFTKDSIHYLTKVALPVDKKLASTGRMSYKWMMPRGNILVAEVKGGPVTINHAFVQMEYYMKDFGRNAPAIPFTSLVTNRLQQPDSSQWLTRVYFPVME